MKPNIIIVMTDQQRADLRKKMGYQLDTMPFLDEWSKDGLDFNKAYTSNPTCMPARVSMFTGRYPESHKVRTNHSVEDALYTEDLLDVLKNSGYKTALCGKNHSHHKDADFDYCVTNTHLGFEGNNRKKTAFEDFLKQTKFMMSEVSTPFCVEEQFPYKNVSSLFDFIDNHTENEPFFSWVSFAEPHNPYQVPKPYYDMFPPQSLPKIDTSVDGKGYKFNWLSNTWKKVIGENLEDKILRMRSNYHGMLRLIDDQFKRIVEGIEERGLTKNTLIIYLSDHGDFVGEYGMMRKGPELPEVLTRIPMIWKGFGVNATTDISSCHVNIVDIFPTICNILNQKIPLGCQGKSILPILKNENIPFEEFDSTYVESGFGGLYWTDIDDLELNKEGACSEFLSFDCLNTWTQCGQVRMVRKGNYKIQLDMMGTGYLYDLKNDMYEIKNLWDCAEYSAIKMDLLTELMSSTLKMMDVLPVPHRRYRVKLHPQDYWKQDYCEKDKGVNPCPILKELF